MRKGSCFLPTVLLGSFGFLISIHDISAQAPGSGQPVARPEDVPAAQLQISAIAPGQESPRALSPSRQYVGETPDDPSAERKSVTADPLPGNISGTVTDENGDLIPGSTVALEEIVGGDHRTVTADDNGSFEFNGLKPGIPYQVRITAKGFADWTSPPVIVKPGQFEFLKEIAIKPSEVTTITVSASSEQIAVEQVRLEEKQRVLGIIPNFYVVYGSDAAPLSAKLKFKLALRVSVDPIAFLGAGFLGGINQAANTPNYVQGAKGYGQRMGAVYADGVTDIMVGGAILPSLLHQDPRYYYQGTGSNGSRFLHAIANPFICKGDDGRREINYSSIGGDLASSAISNAYYPSSNRGAGLMFENVLIDTGERTVSSLVQEFILHKFTSGARAR